MAKRRDSDSSWEEMEAHYGIRIEKPPVRQPTVRDLLEEALGNEENGGMEREDGAPVRRQRDPFGAFGEVYQMQERLLALEAENEALRSRMLALSHREEERERELRAHQEKERALDETISTLQQRLETLRAQRTVGVPVPHGLRTRLGVARAGILWSEVVQPPRARRTRTLGLRRK